MDASVPVSSNNYKSTVTSSARLYKTKILFSVHAIFYKQVIRV